MSKYTTEEKVETVIACSTCCLSGFILAIYLSFWGLVAWALYLLIVKYLI